MREGNPDSVRDETRRHVPRRGGIARRLCLTLVFAASLATSLACDRSPEAQQEKADQRATKERAITGARRCGDFLSEAEAKQLGVEDYRPGKGETNELRGLVCALHPVVISIFMADQYDTMLAGPEAIEEMKPVEGPELGKKTAWFASSDTQQVMFVSEKERFAFGVSGAERDKVLEAAKLVSEGR